MQSYYSWSGGRKSKRVRENVCQVIIHVNCIINIYYISNYITKLHIILGFMHR
jgi:hypothetical protein